MNDRDAILSSFGQSNSLIGDGQISTIDDNGPSFEYDPELPKLKKLSVSIKPKTNGPNVSMILVSVKFLVIFFYKLTPMSLK